MRILVDMNLSPRWVEFLESAGLAAVHWAAIGAGDAPDRELLEHAKLNGYVLLTQDMDFPSILAASGENRPSVVLIRVENNSPEALGEVLVEALRQAKQALHIGAVVVLDIHRRRIRLLPL